MRLTLRLLISKLRVLIDLILLPFVISSGIILYMYRRIGSSFLKLSTKALLGLRIFPIRDFFYEPLFNENHLRFSLRKERNLPRLNLNQDVQLSFMNNLKFSDELLQMKLEVNSKKSKMVDHEFRFKNGFFESGDVEFLYQFIRYTQPKKIVEIGSGYSTLIAARAIAQNKLESGQEIQHICIEPYSNNWLERIPNITVIRQRIEEFNVDWSTLLSAGDLLFIDSSHVIRPQGDVLYEYLEIIPSLKSGVFVHVHDIFTPRDYLDSWVINEKRFWNEQYLLESILQNPRYEIVAALNFLKHNHYSELLKVCPYLSSEREPVSMYFKVVSD